MGMSPDGGSSPLGVDLGAGGGTNSISSMSPLADQEPAGRLFGGLLGRSDVSVSPIQQMGMQMAMRQQANPQQVPVPPMPMAMPQDHPMRAIAPPTMSQSQSPPDIGALLRRLGIG